MISKKQFLNSTCRVCGSATGIYINILDDKCKSYLRKVHDLLPVKISSTDDLPKKVCHLCIATITDFHNLTAKCKQTQEKLQNVAKNFNKEESSKPSKSNKHEKKRSGSSPRTQKSTIDSSSEKEIDTYVIVNARTSPQKTRTENDQRSVRNERSEGAEAEKDTSSDSEADSEEVSTTVPELSANKSPKPTSKESSNTDKSKTEQPVDSNWTVQKLKGGENTLFICNKCNVILLYESSTKTHNCDVKTEGQSKRRDQNTNSKIANNRPDENIANNESVGVKKKRRRIMVYTDDESS